MGPNVCRERNGAHRTLSRWRQLEVLTIAAAISDDKLTEKCERIRRRVADESAEKLRDGKKRGENLSKK
jgi:hypothetical protein